MILQKIQDATEAMFREMETCEKGWEKLVAGGSTERAFYIRRVGCHWLHYKFETAKNH